jgi:hypothetical protein
MRTRRVLIQDDRSPLTQNIVQPDAPETASWREEPNAAGLPPR